MAKLSSPATFALILLNLAAFFGVTFLHSRELWLALGLNIYFLEKLYIFEPLTSIFIHAGTAHLFMNMIFLYQVGTMSELYLGTKKFIIFYIVGGVLTQILSFIYIYFAFKNEKFINFSRCKRGFVYALWHAGDLDALLRQKDVVWLLCHRCCHELFATTYGHKCRMVRTLYRLDCRLFVC
ncbi:rhomboid family intramembrane serine protease [Campylobacter concisus]